MSKTYDVCVIGLGGMGSAALYHASLQSKSVIGIEQHELGHDLGSSHGETRLIRKIYFEHPDYVPLLTRAYENWDKLSSLTGDALFERTGVVIFCPKSGGEVLAGMEVSAKEHNLDLEIHSGPKSPYPQLNMPSGFVAAIERDAGFLRVENCVVAHLKAAQVNNAVVRSNTRVDRLDYEEGVFSISIGDDRIMAQKIILTAGPWVQQLLPDLANDLTINQVTQFWLKPQPGFRQQDGMPCFAYDFPDHGFFYGFPQISELGLKMAAHAPGAALHRPEERGHQAPEKDRRTIRTIAKTVLCNWPEVQIMREKLCLYTMSQDEHFILDQKFGGKLTYLAGMSGHGFKFASALGQALAELSITGKTDLPISFLNRRSS